LVALYWGAAIVGAATSPSLDLIVRSNYQKIAEAQQIDELFGPAWHSVANFGDGNTVDWITEATIAARYELIMVVPARVDQRTGELTEVIGKPQMFLMEVTSVQGRSISYGQQHEINPNQWQKVVAAQGDFSVIGISLNLNNPVPGFREVQNRPREGIRGKPR
jgi:formate-dependent phosphoribosylglycinamide formyltransferase (GAR transformylase)